MAKRNRDELVAIVQKLLDGEGDDAEVASWLAELSANLPHPAISDLIFYPTGDREPTAEEIVDEAMTVPPAVR